MTTPTDLIQQLRHSGWRVRTALYLLPAADMRRLPEWAARLNIGYADARTPLLATIAPTQRYLHLTEVQLIHALDALCQEPTAKDCLLVGNMDLLLAKLGGQERERVWQTLFQAFPHRPRALLLAMPQSAPTLPPEPQLSYWAAEGRLAT